MPAFTGLWPVLRTSLNTTFGLSAARYRYLIKRERVWEPLVILGSLGVLAAMFEVMMYQMASGLVTAGAQLGQPGVAFTFALLATLVLVFIFGLFMVFSVFYFSTDLPLLVPLPLRPGTIVLAKFGTILAGQYLGVVAVLAPTALAYARLAGGGPLYWLSVVLVLVLAPVLPLILASALALVLMRVINRRHRDLLMIIASLGIVAAVLAFQISIAQVPEDQVAEYLRQLLAGQIGLVNLVGRGFPPAVWATRAITEAGTLPGTGALAAFTAASVAGLGVLAALGERLFYGGLIGGQELARRRPASGEAVATARALALKGLRREEALRALYRREWRLFMRHPLYVMNGFMASVIVPVLFVFGLAVPRAELDMVTSWVPLGGDITYYATLAVAGLVAFLAGLNTTASTSVSREGRHLWISKVIPVEPWRMVQAKILFAAVSTLVSAAPVVAAYGVFLRPPAGFLAASALLGLLGSAVLLLLGLLVDMARPFLTWTNPQQAVKSNLNVVLQMPMAAALFVGASALSSWLRGGLGLGGPAALAVIGAVLAGLAAAAYRVTVSAAGRLYGRLEV